MNEPGNEVVNWLQTGGYLYGIGVKGRGYVTEFERLIDCAQRDANLAAWWSQAHLDPVYVYVALDDARGSLKASESIRTSGRELQVTVARSAADFRRTSTETLQRLARADFASVLQRLQRRGRLPEPPIAEPLISTSIQHESSETSNLMTSVEGRIPRLSPSSPSVEIRIPLLSSIAPENGKYAYPWIEDVQDFLSELDELGECSLADDGEEVEESYSFRLTGRTSDSLLAIASRVARIAGVPCGVVAILTEEDGEGSGRENRVQVPMR